MCTLSFVPGLPLGGYLLAHNRDERTSRGPGLPPVIGRLGAARIVAPRDSDAGGTWIGVDARGQCLAILNGDSEPAAPPPPDAASRGLLMVDLLQDARPAAVRAELERRLAAGELNVKPFKLAVVAPRVRHVAAEEHGLLAAAPPVAQLLRIDFDGAALHVHEQPGAQCAVSSTYRPAEVAAARGAAFTRFLAALPHEEDLLRGRTAAPSGGTAAPSPRAPGARGWMTDPEPVAAALRAHHASHGATDPRGATGATGATGMHGAAGATGAMGAPGGAGPPPGDAFSICMHRDDGSTVSRTLVIVGPREIRMEYTPGSPCLGAEPVIRTMPRVFR